MSSYSSPVFSIAGAMPGNSEMAHWKTAYINPDADLTTRPPQRRVARGPSFSMAGVMPGGSTMSHWNTAYPTGESIYVAQLRNAEQRAALEGTVVALPKRPARHLPRGGAEAA